MEGIDLNSIALPTLTLFLVIREVVVPLIKKRNGNGADAILKKLAVESHDLHEWHKKVDGDGRPVWYAPVGMKSALEDNTASNRELTRAVNALVKKS